MGEHIITETIKTIVTLDTIELPENPTNGDVIKAMFPDFDREDQTDYFGRVRNLDDHFIKADIDWWNAPYKRR